MGMRQSTLVAVVAGVFGLGVAQAHGNLIDGFDGFEGYAAGPIDGQGNWKAFHLAGSSTADVTSVADDVYEGSRSLKITDTVSWGPVMVSHTTDAPETSGALSWTAKLASNASGQFYVQLGSGSSSKDGDDGNAINRIGFDGASGAFVIQPAGTAVTEGVPSFVADRWYRFEVAFDVAAGTYGQFDLSIVDMTTNSEVYRVEDMDFAWSYTKGTPLSEIVVRSSNTSKGTLYIDNLSSLPIPEPASLSLLGLGAALTLGRPRH